MSTKSIGQLAFEVFHDSLGIKCDWITLPSPNQIAWNEAATVVRYAHHLVEHPKTPCKHDYQRISSDPMDASVRCTKCDYTLLGGNKDIIQKDCKHDYQRLSSDPNDTSVYCKKCDYTLLDGGKVVEETVDGGGISISSKTNEPSKGGGTG